MKKGYIFFNWEVMGIYWKLLVVFILKKYFFLKINGLKKFKIFVELLIGNVDLSLFLWVKWGYYGGELLCGYN